MGLVGAGSPLRAAAAGISGNIVNGTTGKPVAGQTLQLLMPRGGMQQVATATSDASGHFAFASGDIAPDSFYLLQAVYQDVDYHAPVKFNDRGVASVDITVYDSARTPPALRIQSARLIVRAEGGKVHVQEMFALENSAQPPRSYVNADGTFRFHLGKAAGEPTASVAGLMNMPLPQPVNPGKGPGDFSLQYPLKPGVTVATVTYDSDYAAYRLELADSVSYPVDSAELIVAPSSLAVDSALFKAVGADAETSGEKYLAENVPANAALAASVSGEASAGPDAASQAAAGSPADSGVKPVPNSMTRLGAPLLACFLLVLLWAMGVRVAKEWPRWKARQSASQRQKVLEAEAEKLFNSIADLDELFAGGKIAEKAYWKERLDLKARLVVALKKASPALLQSYAIRHTPR
jgi:hypothetical protein